jgi:hypothetical protein
MKREKERRGEGREADEKEEYEEEEDDAEKLRNKRGEVKNAEKVWSSECEERGSAEGAGSCERDKIFVRNERKMSSGEFGYARNRTLPAFVVTPC